METENKNESRWLEIAGGLAVIASVLLLVWEIRQNTRALTAQAMLDLNATANQILNSEAQNEQLAAILVKGEKDLESLSPAEYRQFRSHVYTLINSIDAAYGFYTEGILDEEDFSGWRNFTCPYLAEPSINVIWESSKATFGDDFVLFVADTCDL